MLQLYETYRYNSVFFNMLQVFLEQKKMLKTGLNIAHFREHVKIIEAETKEYFQRWGDSGERSEILHIDLNMKILFLLTVLVALTQSFVASKWHTLTA